MLYTKAQEQTGEKSSDINAAPALIIGSKRKKLCDDKVILKITNKIILDSKIIFSFLTLARIRCW